MRLVVAVAIASCCTAISRPEPQTFNLTPAVELSGVNHGDKHTLASLTVAAGEHSELAARGKPQGCASGAATFNTLSAEAPAGNRLDTIVVPEEAATHSCTIGDNYFPLQEGAEKCTWPGPLTATSGIIGVMFVLLLVHRHKLQRAAVCERAATRLQALVRGHATRSRLLWELALRVLVMERAAANKIRRCYQCWRARRVAAEAANTIRFYYCWWRARRAVTLQRVWRGCRTRLLYNDVTRAGVDLSTLVLEAAFHISDGSFHTISYVHRIPGRDIPRRVHDDIRDWRRRAGIARLLLRMKKATNAKKQHARKAAAEARWAAQERDRNNKIIPGDFTTVRGVLYLVPKSLKDADAMQLIVMRQFGGIPDYRPFGQDDESDDELMRPGGYCSDEHEDELSD